MTRIALAALAMCLLSTAAAGQDGLRSASLPERTPMNPVPPPQVDLFRAAPDTYTPHAPGRRDVHRHWRGWYAFGGSVFDPGYVWGYSPTSDRRTGIDSPEIEPVRRSDPPAPPAAAPVAPPAMPGPPKTFYVIPGCYAGDRPPQADRLRPGCDISKTRTLPPVAGGVR